MDITTSLFEADEARSGQAELTLASVRNLA